MAYAVTQSCCNDATCISVCPVNCIHPTPEEREAGPVEMVFIDPDTCIDCGACADACPTGAIVPVDLLRGPDTVFADLNREYYEAHPDSATWDALTFPTTVPQGFGDLRVAVVGTGPSAVYAARALLTSSPAHVTMIDRLPVAGGLLRSGVAPDHPDTKRLEDAFAWTYDHLRVSVRLNVEVGRDVTHAELLEHHHAVVYAVGAPGDRALGIPGEDLPGSMAAADLVAWYNAQPDREHGDVALASERVVVIGNGNVALDVARVLLTDPDALARTDIADHALDALRRSRVREVVVLGRRGPEEAAYSRSELVGMRAIRGVDLVVEDHPRTREVVEDAAVGSKAAMLRDVPRTTVDWSAPPAPGRRVVLAFWSAPVALEGDGAVSGVRVADTASDAGERVLAASMVVRSIGYRGAPVPGLPFDTETATVPNDRGRVVDATGRPVPGTYVVGWIKRGSRGGIGANRSCAQETVEALVADASADLLPPPTRSPRDLALLLRRRRKDVVDLRRMRAIDRSERLGGVVQGRPRRKFATVPELLGAAPRRWPSRR
ncbi:FAD-dependent oxidoreductase [Mumia zhuanghuii]|uniref:ferredoxin--NADP(+) reductase n=1 Tax=Mumia zhuanghuii TaxID=2585211 RepID=A0A5C4MG91_9ACTN|nr:FAD-dependent oxidoreductase [Mumia zhuanghuii]TNC40979.1 4Fe-4S dicluster domain-containing protein [Mumia zhuanghuii]TNC49277.1 4Fe-4S dicluster domain-containing protein [Mumia zhuanghuii]